MESHYDSWETVINCCALKLLKFSYLLLLLRPTANAQERVGSVLVFFAVASGGEGFSTEATCERSLTRMVAVMDLQVRLPLVLLATGRPRAPVSEAIAVLRCKVIPQGPRTPQPRFAVADPARECWRLVGVSKQVLLEVRLELETFCGFRTILNIAPELLNGQMGLHVRREVAQARVPLRVLGAVRKGAVLLSFVFCLHE